MTSKINAIGLNYSARNPQEIQPNVENNDLQSPATVASADCTDTRRSTPAESISLTVVRRHDRNQRSCMYVQRELYFFARTTPSIRTVEASANAKVFLETYFNSIHTVRESRFERRNELECWIQQKHLSLCDKERCRREWYAKESYYTRKSRKLKARSRVMTLNKKEKDPGGFEILQTLGKGSFGTVCLVKEKVQKSETMDLAHERISSESSSSNSRARSDQLQVQLSRGHLLLKVNQSDGELKSRKRKSTRQKPILQLSQSSTVYAMKIIRKAEMIKNSQEGHIRAERDFLVASARSPWVVDLFTSFQDKTNLYLVMEYMIGGDFLSLLIKYDTLEEKHTKFYIAEMIMCVEAAHGLGWIHRDIKPDNFLISASGHLKIADFGLAFDGHWSHDQNYYHAQRYSVLQKFEIPVIGDHQDVEMIQAQMQEADFDEHVYLNERERNATLRHSPSLGDDFGCKTILEWRDKIGRRAFARSLVGTSQYMAPEIIEGREYDGRCDYWSVGVILFECLFGHTPFNSRDKETTKRRILAHETYLKLPPVSSTRSYNVPSKSAMNLIKSLLTRREDRLSSSLYKQNDLGIGEYDLNHSCSAAGGQFVYTNDALNIKRDPFFQGVPWSDLHQRQPPHVPVITSTTDTSHFDPQTSTVELEDPEDGWSSDSDEGSFYSIDLDSRPQNLDGPNGDLQRPSGKRKTARKFPVVDAKTRPRDRILRDDIYSRDAMKLRKKNAFLGYTYRRPPRAKPTMTRTNNSTWI